MPLLLYVGLHSWAGAEIGAILSGRWGGRRGGEKQFGAIIHGHRTDGEQRGEGRHKTQSGRREEEVNFEVNSSAIVVIVHYSSCYGQMERGRKRKEEEMR